MLINAADWYWYVGSNTTSVYGSARNIYVNPSTDVGYANWLASVGYDTAPSIASESDIWNYVQTVLPLWLWNGTTMSQPALNQYTKVQLQNYNASVRWNKVNGGMVAAGVPVKTDDVSRGLLNDAKNTAVNTPGWTTVWYGSDGGFYNVTGDQVIQMYNTVGNHTNNCYQVYSTTNTAITDNTITLPSQIDTAYTGL
jgi:hypothetical protein